MIRSTFGIQQEPFNRKAQHYTLIPQQKEAFDTLKVHAQYGGLSVITGNPGVGKSVLKSHVLALAEDRSNVVVSLSRTMHTYVNVLRQLLEAFKIEATMRHMERALIDAAFQHVSERKTLYTLIDEAHLMNMTVLRKCRLLFDQFPSKHNLVLFGQPELMYYLSLGVNQDLKNRITYSKQLIPITDDDLERIIVSELEAVKLGINVFDPAAIELILRSVQGNLRLCRNLCYGSLMECCREGKRAVTIRHVNQMLMQPHWRSHDELIKAQVNG